MTIWHKLVLASVLIAAPTSAAEPPPAAAAAAEAPKPAKPRDAVKLIHAGQLLAIPGEAPLQQQTIVVRNDRIEKIVPGFAPATGYDDADVKVIDLKDRFVLPGLMDMHVHLSFGPDTEGFKVPGMFDGGEPTKAQRDDVAGIVDAMDNARKTLQAGYTTVRNVGSAGWHIAALKQAVADGRLVGPRILTSMYTLNPGSGDGPGTCNGVEGCRRAARKQIDMGADLIKVYATCSGSKPCGHQDAPATFLEDELKAIVDIARSRQIKVAAHAHGEDGIRTALRAGANSIEHGSYTPQDAHALFIKNGAFLVPTLAVSDRIKKDIIGSKGEMRAVMQNFLDKHGPRMIAAYRAGVKIAAGSDAGVTEHGNNARELEIYVGLGMPAGDAIRAATVNGASLVGRSKDLGTIEAGKIADVIAVTGDPLKDIKALKSVAFVMKDGTVFREAGQATR